MLGTEKRLAQLFGKLLKKHFQKYQITVFIALFMAQLSLRLKLDAGNSICCYYIRASNFNLLF